MDCVIRLRQRELEEERKDIWLAAISVGGYDGPSFIVLWKPFAFQHGKLINERRITAYTHESRIQLEPHTYSVTREPQVTAPQHTWLRDGATTYQYLIARLVL